jgi:hypothetical protein
MSKSSSHLFNTKVTTPLLNFSKNLSLLEVYLSNLTGFNKISNNKNWVNQLGNNIIPLYNTKPYLNNLHHLNRYVTNSETVYISNNNIILNNSKKNEIITLNDIYKFNKNFSTQQIFDFNIENNLSLAKQQR